MKLELQNLSIIYKNNKRKQANQVIEGLELSIHKGEFFTILGKSGSGKSTILKAIAGLIEPESGHISIDGTDQLGIPVEQRNISYVFQRPLLFPHLSVSDNIAFGPSIHGWSKERTSKMVNELLGLLQIENLGDRMPSEISGGQQQRVSLARALALNHDILLMDEPFSSLDPSLREEMGTLIKSIQRQLNLTIVFVTHDVDEATLLSDRIGFLSHGKLMQVDQPNTLYTHPATMEIGDFMGDSNWIPITLDNRQLVSPFGQKEVEDTELENLNGAEPHMLLRPETLSLSRAPGKSCLRMQLDAFRSIGPRTTYTLNSDSLHLQIIDTKKEPYQIGEFLYISKRDDDFHYVLS